MCVCVFVCVRVYTCLLSAVCCLLLSAVQRDIMQLSSTQSELIQGGEQLQHVIEEMTIKQVLVGVCACACAHVRVYVQTKEIFTGHKKNRFEPCDPICQV